MSKSNEIIATNLKCLIKAKCGTIRQFAKEVGLTENTVQNHLKDGNWDMNQMIRIIKALNMPERFVYIYFFEPMLEKNKSSEATK